MNNSNKALLKDLINNIRRSSSADYDYILSTEMSDEDKIIAICEDIIDTMKSYIYTATYHSSSELENT